LISAVDNKHLVDVDQYGEHSDGRSNEVRGDAPLTVVDKKYSNNYTWTIVQQGVSKEGCDEILDGFTKAGYNGTGYIYKSPQFPDYRMKRCHYFILRCVFLTISQTIELQYLLVYSIYTEQGIAISLPLLLLSL
jgi:hypothetical protein